MTDLPSLLILTPLKGAAPHLPAYAAALAQLTYPAERLALGFLVAEGGDGTAEALYERLPGWQARFRRAQAWPQTVPGYAQPPGTPRWAGEIQVARRAALARARNELLLRALEGEDWVLWLDVDVIEYPPDVIQQLLAAGKDIVQPHCVKRYGGPSFDRNTWRDRGRQHLDQLRGEGPLVQLEAVGATMLLVRAEAHRAGLIFPPFPYGRRHPYLRPDNGFGPRGRRWQRWLRWLSGTLHNWLPAGSAHQGEIETEGFGLLAHDMGYECWGLPHLEVRHLDG